MRAAMFREPSRWTSSTSALTSIKRKQIHDLATGRFIREKADVLFLGPPGVGKSFLVQAIGQQAIKSGFVVLYRSIFDLARDFLEEQTPDLQDKTLARYLKPDLIIIDDMGMKQLPRRSGEYLLEIIMRRHENRSTMMTSNRPLEDWAKLIGDVPAATAILDRFLQHAQIINITGKSYRLRKGGGGGPGIRMTPRPPKPASPTTTPNRPRARPPRRRAPRHEARSLRHKEGTIARGLCPPPPGIYRFGPPAGGWLRLQKRLPREKRPLP